MDIFKMMQTGEGIEHLEDHLLDLDSEFRFKCRRCGKCCIHQDTIIFNARDIYNIAKKKDMTMQQVAESYTEAYIGRNSRIPIVHLLSNGPKGACPLLEDGRCSVHDCKPTVCALFPLGRVVMGEKFGEPIENPNKLNVKLEKHEVSEFVLNMFWDAIYQTLYLQYDVAQDFMPQFRAAADKLLRLSEEIMNAEPPTIAET